VPLRLALALLLLLLTVRYHPLLIHVPIRVPVSRTSAGAGSVVRAIAHSLADMKKEE
jgi:hypothetical protein